MKAEQKHTKRVHQIKIRMMSVKLNLIEIFLKISGSSSKVVKVQGKDDVST